MVVCRRLSPDDKYTLQMYSGDQNEAWVKQAFKL